MRTMKKAPLRIAVPAIIVLLLAGVVAGNALWRHMEKRPPKNSFKKSDLIIALTAGPPTYQFVLSDGQILEASYGWREFDDWGFINSINFMTGIRVYKTAVIPEDVYNRVLELTHEIIQEECGELKISFGGWYLVILTPDTIYQVNYRFDNSSEKEQELVAILEEYSPIVVHLGYHSGRAEIKEEEQ